MRTPVLFRQSISVLLAALALAACAGHSTAERVPFTEELITDYRLDSAQRQRLQYYLSDTVTLTRAVGGGRSDVARGKLVSRSGTLVEEVRIAAGTPGVVVASGPGWVAVSFTPNSYLYFVSDRGGNGALTDNRDEERFYPFSRDFDGRNGTVSLDGVAYQADRSSLDAYLLIDREDFSRTDDRASSLPGRWLNERR